MSNRLFAWPVGLISMLGVLAYVCPSYGQNVVADDTVETIVSGNDSFTVTGGSQQLTTLFHSFQEFSPNIANVLFQLDGTQSNVDVVIGRVTGPKLSLIDGQLALTGGNNPDLFLINPNGITFGANANLLLPGSFFASTAESVLFNDGLSFSSREPGNAPLLSVSLPVGLQLGETPGMISLEQSELGVAPGNGFALVGGEVLLNGAQVFASGGRLEIGGLDNNQTVGLLPSNFGWSVDYESANRFQDVQISQQSFIDLSGERGGGGQIQARNLSIKDGTGIESGSWGGLTGGDIALRGSESIAFTGSTPNGQSSSYMTVGVFPNASGNGGNILIETPQLQATDGAQVGSVTFGNGDAGDLTIVTQVMVASGSTPSGAFPTLFAATSSGAGAGGNLNVMTETLQLSAGAQVATGILGGQGNGGNLTVQARQIDLSGISASGFNPSGLFSSSDVNIVDGMSIGPISSGNGGQLTVETEQLTVTNGATINSLTRGQGNAGNIRIVAQDIEVGGGELGFRPINEGNGAIRFDLEPVVANIIAVVELQATGQGGTIDIQTQRLRVRDGGELNASTFGSGAAGRIQVNAQEIELTGQSALGAFPSGIYANAVVGTGNGGDIRLNSDRLVIQDGATVNVGNFDTRLFTDQQPGRGTVGNIFVNANEIRLDRASTITAESLNSLQGNITLLGDKLLLLRDNSLITATSLGQSNGGNIVIDIPVVIGLENSDIVANAVVGSGGNINITTQGLFGLVFREQLTPNNDVTTSSEFGLSGTVAINEFDVQTDSGLVELPASLADTSNQVSQGCNSGSNRFVATGRGGLPAAPTEIMSRDRTWTDIRDLTPFLNSSQAEPPVNTADNSVTEATVWYENALGQIELVATNETVPLASSPTCAVSSMPQRS